MFEGHFGNGIHNCVKGKIFFFLVGWKLFRPSPFIFSYGSFHPTQEVTEKKTVLEQVRIIPITISKIIFFLMIQIQDCHMSVFTLLLKCRRVNSMKKTAEESQKAVLSPGTF